MSTTVSIRCCPSQGGRYCSEHDPKHQGLSLTEKGILLLQLARPSASGVIPHREGDTAVSTTVSIRCCPSHGGRYRSEHDPKHQGLSLTERGILLLQLARPSASGVIPHREGDTAVSTTVSIRCYPSQGGRYCSEHNCQHQVLSLTGREILH